MPSPPSRPSRPSALHDDCRTVFPFPAVLAPVRRGEHFLRAVSLVTAAAGAVLLLSAVFRWGSSGVRTVTALQVSLCEEVSVTGWLIRDEVPLYSPAGSAAPLRAEGEKASAGSILAVTGGEEAVQTARELAGLQLRIRRLEEALAASPAEQSDRIRSLLRTLSAGPPQSAEHTERLKALILRSGTEEAPLTDLLRSLRLQAAELERSLTGTALTAPEAGWYSSHVDGYERILTPAAIETLTDPGLLVPEPVPPQTCGRLIRSPRWYLAASLPADRLPEPGSEAEVTFPDGTCFAMQVLRAEATGQGRGILILSCGNGIGQIAALRTARCTLTFQSCEGVQLPTDALFTDETGQTGVYVLEGAAARWKPVTLLKYGEQGCIAALDRSDTGHLWPGDEILTGNDLYDGKVVYP